MKWMYIVDVKVESHEHHAWKSQYIVYLYDYSKVLHLIDSMSFQFQFILHVLVVYDLEPILVLQFYT